MFYTLTANPAVDMTVSSSPLEPDENVRTRLNIRPRIMEEVKQTRAFGDLSENYEYKSAKQEQRKNDSRVRYLQNMIKTAQIIDDDAEGGSGDKVKL